MASSAHLDNLSLYRHGGAWLPAPSCWRVRRLAAGKLLVINDLGSAETSAKIAEIIRRDLKLGPDAVLAPDAVLFGGELDLDSLDALLLVQSIEREFRIRIPTSAIGRETFATMSTLASVVDSHLQGRVNP